MIGIVTMIIGIEVLLMQSGPHKIELEIMTAGIGPLTFWSGPHLIGVGPVVTGKQVVKVELVKSVTLRLVVKGRKIS